MVNAGPDPYVICLFARLYVCHEVPDCLPCETEPLFLLWTLAEAFDLTACRLLAPSLLQGGKDGLLGPSEWAQLDGSFCGGQRQSPIDIPTHAVDKHGCPLAITLPAKSSAAPSCDLDALLYEADGLEWQVGRFPDCAVAPQINVCQTVRL
jgi:hypothetical protein